MGWFNTPQTGRQKEDARVGQGALLIVLVAVGVIIFVLLLLSGPPKKHIWEVTLSCKGAEGYTETLTRHAPPTVAISPDHGGFIFKVNGKQEGDRCVGDPSIEVTKVDLAGKDT